MSIDQRELLLNLQRAISLHVSGQLDQARPLYEEILAIQPRHPEVLGKLAALSIQTNHPQRALELLDLVLALDPRNAVNHCNRGAACEKLRQWDSALASYDRAIAIDPGLAQAHCNRANVLRELQSWREALEGYDRAIGLKPDYVNAHNNRGRVLMELGRFDEALASYNAAIALNPTFADGYYNRAVLLGKMARPDAAVASYDRAIAIQPRSSAAYFNRALAHLLLGDFPKGWADYEWRWQNDSIPLSREKRHFSQPRWTGTEPIAGKTLYIYSEQGLGDTIQFCRYVPLLAARGANVVLEAQSPLVGLLRGLDGAAEVIAQGQPVPAFDHHCALMSLPLAFKTTLATVPAQIPYLRTDPERFRAWGDALGDKHKCRVGIVWSSGVRPNEPQLRDLNRRNVPLAKFGALSLPNVQFYSLQKGQPAESELADMVATDSLGLSMIDMAPMIHDFADTAALIENLDLVISVDTATAHLAGALGKPVWILACHNACWRWLQDRTDSPWYPTARLYRQKIAEDWDEVIDRVRTDLARYVNSAGENIDHGR
jgi:tetratricopeptide (TPR) repeat protein